MIKFITDIMDMFKKMVGLAKEVKTLEAGTAQKDANGKKTSDGNDNSKHVDVKVGSNIVGDVGNNSTVQIGSNKNKS